MSLQSLSCLLQDRHGQFLGQCQRQGVAVVADVPMCSPSPFLDAPCMMSREVPHLSHKTKRVLLGHPGKPLLGIWLKWKQPLLGTDHDVASLTAILDAWQDMRWLGRHFRFGGGPGSGTRAGSRTCGLGGRLEHPAGLGRNRWDGML